MVTSPATSTKILHSFELVRSSNIQSFSSKNSYHAKCRPAIVISVKKHLPSRLEIVLPIQTFILFCVNDCQNYRSLFDRSGCLVPWFHGTMSRDKALRVIEEWEASRVDGSCQVGAFLFRYSERQVNTATLLLLLLMKICFQDLLYFAFLYRKPPAHRQTRFVPTLE